jgi:dephospho-CoA kinase
MIVVGLTGGIGSGKSTVSALLAQRGAVIVDADVITREVQQPGQPVLAAIAERFGASVLTADGHLDRQRLADIVFNDGDALRALNKIVHPAVADEIGRRIDSQREFDEVRGGDAIVVLDIPLLKQDGRYPIAGILVVDTPIEVAIDRLVRFRGLREDDARARVGRQISREDRLAMADFVIDNGGDAAALPDQLDAAWTWIATLPPAAN